MYMCMCMCICICANVYVCICMYMCFVYMYVYMCVYVSIDIYIFLIFCTFVTFWYNTNLALLLIQPVGCHMLIKNIIITLLLNNSNKNL